VTKKQGEEYRKTIATIETDLPSGLDALRGLDQLKETLESFFKTPGQPAIESEKLKAGAQTDAIDLRPLDSLWQGPTKKGSYWCFSDKPESAQLKALLQNSPNKSLEIQGYTFKISGDSGQFINRWGSGKPH
jgi:hypothetical protein